VHKLIMNSVYIGKFVWKSGSFPMNFQTETGNVQTLVFMYMHKAVSSLRTEAVLVVAQTMLLTSV